MKKYIALLITGMTLASAASAGQFISNGALNKNRVPCSHRGTSFNNCKPGAQANPFHRGCSAASRCARP